MSEKWIGSDVDGVIFDTVPMYIDVINRLQGTSHTVEDMGSYSLEEALGISKEVADAAVTAAISSGEYPLVPGARALRAICRFEGICHLPIFISRRRMLWHWVTTEALRREFGAMFVLYCNDGRPKSATVAEYELDYFIEDGLKYAIDIVINTDCKVFLLNAPYNQRESLEYKYREIFDWAIHSGQIVRVNNWLEIGVLIHRDINKEVNNDTFMRSKDR